MKDVIEFHKVSDRVNFIAWLTIPQREYGKLTEQLAGYKERSILQDRALDAKLKEMEATVAEKLSVMSKQVLQA